MKRNTLKLVSAASLLSAAFSNLKQSENNMMYLANMADVPADIFFRELARKNSVYCVCLLQSRVH